MQGKRGFTLYEVLVVAGISLLLGALLMPVYRRVLMNVKISASQQKLRQLHIALSLYRSEHDSPVIVHTLPTTRYVFGTYLGLSKEAFLSPCDPRPTFTSYTYWFDWYEESLQNFTARGEESVIFSDITCNEDPRAWGSHFAEKRGLGIQLDGRLLNLRKRGFPGEFWWWRP